MAERKTAHKGPEMRVTMKTGLQVSGSAIIYDLLLSRVQGEGRREQLRGTT